jgi:hypothetical protein
MRRIFSSPLRAILGVAILLLGFYGAVSASNIAISSNTSHVEFGAGVYEIRACNSFLNINLVEGSTGTFGAPAGLTPLVGLTVSGLNESKCDASKVTLQFLDQAGNPLPLFRLNSVNSLCAPQICNSTDSSLAYSLALTVNRARGLVASALGSALTVQGTKNAHEYSLSFSQPAVLARDVGRILVESSK